MITEEMILEVLSFGPASQTVIKRALVDVLERLEMLPIPYIQRHHVIMMAGEEMRTRLYEMKEKGLVSYEEKYNKNGTVHLRRWSLVEKKPVEKNPKKKKNG